MINSKINTSIYIGWIESIKEFKNISFIYLRNNLGLFQIIIKSPLSVLNLKREMLIRVDIELKNKDLYAKQLIILDSPFLKTYPFELQKFKTKSSRRTKLQYRYFDLKSRQNYLIFNLKSKIITNIRNYLNTLNFLEINTPKIISVGSEGGAELFKLDYFGNLAFLTQSPQLYKQMIINAGFNKIFEINYIYRAEKSDTPRHLCESLCLDVEYECDNLDSILILLQNILKNSLTKDMKQNFEELGLTFKEITDSDFIILTYNDVLNLLNVDQTVDLNHNHEIEILKKTNKRFCFIIDWPIDLKPFYIKKEKNIALGFDLISTFAQLSSGGLRENEYSVLEKNIINKGMDGVFFKDYLNSFGYCSPKHAGFGFGIDRLICELLHLNDIRDAVLFPRDKYITKP